LTTSRVERPTLEGYNPLGAEFFRDPAPILSKARAECPVFYYPPMDYWVVASYDDIVEAVTDWQSFSQQAASLLPVPPELAHRVSENYFLDTFMALDPPGHTVSRKAVNQAFTRSRVLGIQPTVVRIANQLIDGFIDAGSCDLMNDFCYQLSLRTIVSLIGLPDSEDLIAKYKLWAEDFLVLVTPRTAPGEPPLRSLEPEESLLRWGRTADAHEFLYDLLEQRRKKPTDDLISALLQIEDDEGGRGITDERIVAHMVEMITAGTDTTANLLGEVTIRLNEHPDIWEQVRRDPNLLENTIEEALRYRGMAIGLFRWTTRDVELSGVTIPAHSRVQLLYQSAGRDESHFSCPNDFDIRRENAAEHLGFGRGRHFCLGAPLARLEARTALEILYRRIPDLRIEAGAELHYHHTLVAFILESLPVRWR